ncbi:MAG TPA: hypothetical protein VGF86_14070 [Candidatus Tumulicola sp.]
MKTIIAELASKGIVGGPTVSRISEAAISEIAERKQLASEALRRAVESAGVRYYSNLPSDLNDALQKIVDGSMGDVIARGRDRLRHLANPIAAQQNYVGNVTIHTVSLASEFADLAHFAESLKTKRRENALKFSWKIAIPIAVALLLWIGSMIPGWFAATSRVISSRTAQLLQHH